MPAIPSAALNAAARFAVTSDHANKTFRPSAPMCRNFTVAFFVAHYDELLPHRWKTRMPPFVCTRPVEFEAHQT